MEITKEYLDKKFSVIVQRFATIEEKMATKDDLAALSKQLENYIEETAQIVIEATAFNFQHVEQRLDKLENLIKPINTEAYHVREASALPKHSKPLDVHQTFVTIMAKRGMKWPYDSNGKRLDKTA